MFRGTSVFILFCILLGAAAAVSAQQLPLPPAITVSQGMANVPITYGDEVQRQLVMAANAQRQVEIKRDSEKMAELTQELNNYLQKAGSTVMSIDALKKAEQIEKLAKSVRSKMKQSF